MQNGNVAFDILPPFSRALHTAADTEKATTATSITEQQQPPPFHLPYQSNLAGFLISKIQVSSGCPSPHSTLSDFPAMSTYSMCLQLKALANGGHYPNDIFEPEDSSQAQLSRHSIFLPKNGSGAKPRWIGIPEPSSVIRFKSCLRLWSRNPAVI